MPPVQTTYGDLREGVAGQVANMVPSTTISRTVEADTAFGVAVSQGSSDDSVIGYTDNFVGVTARVRSVGAGQDQYDSGDTAAVLTKGSIYVIAQVEVDAGEPVHVVAGGLFSNTGGDQIAGARWDTSASSGNIAIIRLG